MKANINIGIGIAVVLFVLGINFEYPYISSFGALLLGILLVRFNEHVLDELIAHQKKYPKKNSFLYRTYDSAFYLKFQKVMLLIVGSGFAIFGLIGLITPII